jgi:hypothetical protein
MVFYEIGLPLPWLSGPAAAVAVAAVSGSKVGIPGWLRETAIIVLGATLGSSVTPATLQMLPHWPLTMAGLICALVAVMISSSIYLERVHGFDRMTARLASVPGALNYVLALAAASNADLRRVTIIQVVRITAILLIVPGLTELFGVHPRGSLANAGLIPVIWWEVVVLMCLATAGAFLFRRFGAPAPSLFGAMTVGAILYGSGWLTSGIPVSIALPGFLVLGSMIGSNFAGTEARLLVATLGAGLGSLAVGALSATLIAIPVAWMVKLPITEIWLAYAPGGVETSAILAMALGLDAAFVSGHHVARVTFLSLIVPFWMGRDAKPASEDDRPEDRV